MALSAGVRREKGLSRACAGCWLACKKINLIVKSFPRMRGLLVNTAAYTRYSSGFSRACTGCCGLGFHLEQLKRSFPRVRGLMEILASGPIPATVFPAHARVNG